MRSTATPSCHHLSAPPRACLTEDHSNVMLFARAQASKPPACHAGRELGQERVTNESAYAVGQLPAPMLALLGAGTGGIECLGRGREIHLRPIGG
jgi:hypothetical protein